MIGELSQFDDFHQTYLPVIVTVAYLYYFGITFKNDDHQEFCHKAFLVLNAVLEQVHIMKYAKPSFVCNICTNECYKMGNAETQFRSYFPRARDRIRAWDETRQFFDECSLDKAGSAKYRSHLDTLFVAQRSL
jgi:hypothetical protein